MTLQSWISCVLDKAQPLLELPQSFTDTMNGCIVQFGFYLINKINH